MSVTVYSAELLGELAGIRLFRVHMTSASKNKMLEQPRNVGAGNMDYSFDPVSRQTPPLSPNPVCIDLIDQQSHHWSSQRQKQEPCCGLHDGGQWDGGD